MSHGSIVTLTSEEKIWWQKTIKEFRSRMLATPKEFVELGLKGKAITKTSLIENVENLLIDQRDEIYQTYLAAEAKMNEEVISHLIESRELPRSIFDEIVDTMLGDDDMESGIDKEFRRKLGSLVGSYTGKIFPYLYELNLSSTNSRRSRAGTTFEILIEKALEIYGYPFQNQSALGSDFFSKHKIGKKVDLVIPGRNQYESRRSGCAIVSVKTSLRERWQEVVEELQRSNVPHIYLATLDEGISNNQVDIMKQYNITLIVRASEKKLKFTNSGTVCSFQTFYDEVVPHLIQGWPEFRVEK